jgi:hypothetical protein
MLSNVNCSTENPLNCDTKVECAEGISQSSTDATYPPHNDENISSTNKHRDESQQEIADENCCVGDDGKINTPKKRFFDLKKTAESATSRISSISPSRFSLNSLTPKLRRKSAANNKLSQLERQSNLFIRDGSDSRINNTTTTTMSSVPMESKHPKGKKSSLIPSFVTFKATIKPNGGEKAKNLCKKNSNQDEIEALNGGACDVNANEGETMQDDDENHEKIKEMLKNVPVRQKKSGHIPHMENYCLFDPAVDFYNEKLLRKNNFALPSLADLHFPIASNFSPHRQQPQLARTYRDISEHDERRLAHHNYYEIDPELLEQDEAACAPNVDDNFAKSKVYGTATVAQQISSSSSSSCDYPSLFNSVIVETTPSSTIGSTDDDGACHSVAINHKNVTLVDHHDVIVSADVSTATTTGKFLCVNHVAINCDPLKSSHSLPQLQNVGVNGDCHNGFNGRMAMTIEMRKANKKARPLSSDSGFTTPSPPNESMSSKSASNSSSDGNQVDNLNSIVKCDSSVNKREATVFNQCDSLQQLIEVSNNVFFVLKIESEGKLKS